MLINKKILLPISLLSIVIASGCTHLVSPMPMEAVPTATPAHEINKSELESVRLDHLSVKISRGTKIGVSYFVYSVCGGYGGGDIFWNHGRINTRNIEFRDIFFDELDNANFRVLGDSKKMFNKGQERASFSIGAQITKIQINLCDEVEWLKWQRMGKQSGEAVISVDWQVFSNIEKRVVYKTTTKGYWKQLEGVPFGTIVLIQNAFGAATANLGAKPEFSKILKRDRVTESVESAPLDQKVLKLKRIRTFQQPIAENMRRVQAAAVTIDLGEDGHGSGFFITRDGHLLTNFHVVGDGSRVAVRLASGTTLTGRVLRRHQARDVALVKIDAQGTQPLPFRAELARVGEEVFAIGAPRTINLSTTVTKGIVSALRRNRSNKLLKIQADVDIHGGSSGGPLVDARGNLVGISVSGFSATSGQESIGLNFFIPINDALKKLNIELVDPDRVPAVAR